MPQSTASVPRGVWVALLTPLDAKLNVDVPRLVAHAKDIMQRGVDGICLFGTTGEGPSFSVQERMDALEATIKAGIPAAKIMMGTGCPALSDTVELTKHSVKVGCPAALVLPPFYFKGPSDEGLFRFFASLIDQVNDPRLRVLLYHIPQLSAVGFSYELVAKLRAAYPQAIAGIKDSLGDWKHTEGLLSRFPELAIFVGNEPDIARAKARGGAGTICGMGNIMPELVRAIYDAGEAKSQEPVAQITAAVKQVLSVPFISALKAYLADKKKDSGYLFVRPPFTNLSDLDAKKLINGLDAVAKARVPA
jgi:4-hydroxy-tetrahydrodipicolinate synthase